MHRIGIVLLMFTVAACGGGAGSRSVLVVDDWGGAELTTVCVTGQEDYGVSGGITPVQEGLRGLFAAETIVDSGCDATIAVTTTGRARSATYDLGDPVTGAPTSRLFTGADVAGTLTLTAPDRPTLTAEIAGSRFPPASWNTMMGRPSSAASAPFWTAARPEVCLVLWGWFRTSEVAAVRVIVPGLLIDEDTVAQLRADGVIPEDAPGPFPCW